MTRTDAHSPANLVTEDYRLLLTADNEGRPGWVLLNGEFGMEIARHLARTDRLGRGTHQCHHCGARIRYFAILEHIPTGDYIAVGETCLDRFDLTTDAFHALRRQAELDRQVQRIRKAIDAFVQANPDLAWMGDRNADGPEASLANGFVQDIARKLRLYGELSQRQVDAVRTAITRDAERAAAIANDPTIWVAAPEGRVQVTGEVLAVKFQDSDFGGSWKMLVKVAGQGEHEAWKLWVTVPSALDVERGDSITIKVTVTPKAGEESFAYGKRPTVAKA